MFDFSIAQEPSAEGVIVRVTASADAVEFKGGAPVRGQRNARLFAPGAPVVARFVHDGATTEWMQIGAANGMVGGTVAR
jgi:hypothetical protein